MSSDEMAVAPKRCAPTLHLRDLRRRRLSIREKYCLPRGKPGATLNPWRKVDIKGSARAMALASSLQPS
jgi:hypothetical protein